MSPLRSVADHRARLLEGLESLPAVSVPTPRALGLVLAHDVVARVDLPGFDNSAMDGYAVRSAECAGAASRGGGASDGGVTLPVSTDIAAGDTRLVTLPLGHAARIMTGAPMPEGADAVVPVEFSDGGVEQVRLVLAPEAGRHVRRRGEDVRAGELLCAAGAFVTPGRVALLAAGNVPQVSVHARPRVCVLSTGDELLDLGATPGHGQIIDSNQLMLAALVEAAGGEVVHCGRLPDEPDAVRVAFAAPPGEPDLVLTSGGVSMGAHDTVKEVLRELGGVEFVKVAMRPGMPQGGGRLPALTRAGGPVPIITLPGNPVSSFVSFHVFVLPVLRRLAARPERVDEREVTAGATWQTATGKTEFTRVRLEDGVAHPQRGQGSHMLGALAEANAFAVVPAEVETVQVGDVLTAIPFLGEVP